MKKRIGIYGVVWAICLAVFQVIAFVTPGGTEKFDASFWIGYAFITAAFLGQLICAALALRESTAKRLFYRIPLITVSYAGLVLMLIAGGVCMAISAVPEWCGIVACTLVLAIHAIALIKASVAGGIVAQVDERVRSQTYLIKRLESEAHSLMLAAENNGLRAVAKRVWEAFRYSDPVSGPRCAEINEQIEKAYAAFSESVWDGDCELADAISQDLIRLLESRKAVGK